MMQKILKINRILGQKYGPHSKEKVNIDPAMFLIQTILSQNTNDKNRDKAFENLLEYYSTTEEILESPRDKLAKIIYTSGHYNVKAKRIQEVLEEIKNRRGNLDLNFLENLPTQEAMEFLTSLPGIGIKSAAVLMNFRFNHNTFPVDTHIHRVSRRIGLVPEKSTAEKTQIFLEEKIPEDLKFQLHMNLITHGRKICKAPIPKCSICPIQHYCDYYWKNFEIK